MQTAPSSVQRGFTLIEVAVAFAIFTLALGAFYESFSGAVRRNLLAHDRDQAVLIAQSLLTQQRVAPQPWEPDSSGHLADGWLWRIQVAPYAPNGMGNPWRALVVTVHVGRQDAAAREVVLRSVELARVTR